MPLINDDLILTCQSQKHMKQVILSHILVIRAPPSPCISFTSTSHPRLILTPPSKSVATSVQMNVNSSLLISSHAPWVSGFKLGVVAAM